MNRTGDPKVELAPCTPPHRRSAGYGTKIRSRWPEWITLFFYTAIVAFAIPYHEPWADEAQSWQLARTLSPHDLLFKYLRYEGTPGLWHFLLWILIRVHVSYSGMHWICGAIAVFTTSLLIFRSPFPRYLKLTLPFTYFLLFQYAVVARSYVLVPLLLFMIACWWKGRPIRIAILLGFLANVALHASVISGGLAIVYCIVQIREGTMKQLEYRRELLWSAAIVLIFYAFAIWTTWPASNHSYMRGEHSFVVNAILSIVWGICQPWILSIPFWIAIALSLHARRGLFYLLPVLFFSIFSGVAFANFWHSGLLVPVLICLLWITWPGPLYEISRNERNMRLALIFLAGVQIVWSAYALDYDHYHAYAPSQAAAEFLKPLVRHGATVAVTSIDGNMANNFEAVGLLPYFDHNIYVNQPEAFWWWSTSNPTEHLFDVALRSHPPSIVVVEATRNHPDDPINLNYPRIKLLTRYDYRFTNVFCGAMPEPRLVLVAGACNLIFQRSAGPQDSLAKTNKPAAVTGSESNSRPSLPNSLPDQPPNKAK